MITSKLTELGLTSDEAKIYLDLLEHSPTSVRKIASRTGIGRQTVFTALKKFITLGLASYHDRGKSKIFAAENPRALKNITEQREEKLSHEKKSLQEILPELQTLFKHSDYQPKVKYYEGAKEVGEMLRDVLATMKGEAEREYYVYSTKGKREIIYTEYPNFSEDRIRAGIRVKVIAFGKGGTLRGLDERRWLSSDPTDEPSYMVIYGNKISMVTLTPASIPVGVIIDDAASARTQKIIFKTLWKTLK